MRFIYLFEKIKGTSPLNRIVFNIVRFLKKKLKELHLLIDSCLFVRFFEGTEVSLLMVANFLNFNVGQKTKHFFFLKIK